jgi:hypothetical protein
MGQGGRWGKNERERGKGEESKEGKIKNSDQSQLRKENTRMDVIADVSCHPSHISYGVTVNRESLPQAVTEAGWWTPPETWARRPGTRNEHGGGMNWV